MAIETNWHDPEETIFVWRFIEKWTWDEFYNLLDHYIPVSAAKPYRLDTIFDFTHSQPTVPNIMTHIKRANARETPNQGILVAVGPTFVRVMTAALRNVLKDGAKKYFWTATFDEAVTAIHADRAKTGEQASTKKLK